MNTDDYEAKLLSNWEDVFRQGLLTFWVFVALQDGEMNVQDIKQRVEKLTRNTYVTSEQALYRTLRKHYDLELVDYREVPGSAGPMKKLYKLSNLGEQLLTEFTSKNISLFSQPEVQKLLKDEKPNKETSKGDKP